MKANVSDISDSNIVLHPQTKQHIERFLARPSHALLLAGPEGSGKQYIGEYVARQLLGMPAEDDLSSYGFLRSVLPEKDKTVIGIEAIRDLQSFVTLRLPANSRGWRIILINNAHALTTEAQNALLKLLEEPPPQTVFLLTSSAPEQLLPTIRSRVQQLTVLLPSQANLIAHFVGRGLSDEDILQAYMMSGGLPGLMAALLEDADHPLRIAVQTAKKLLQSTQFERLCMVDDLAKKKTEVLRILFVLQHMARKAIVQAAQAAADTDSDTSDSSTSGATLKRIKQWHRVQRAAYEAEQAYAVSAQAKLTLTNLMLSL